MNPLTLQRAVPGGDALGRLDDGRVVFVSGAFPGDVVELDGVVQRRGVARATGFRLLQASPHRRPSPCPVAERCGGCDWMAIDEGEQRRLKRELVDDALRRVGKFTQLYVPPVTGEAALGHRSRIRLHLGLDGSTGFFSKRSHELVEFESCAVCTPRLNQAIQRLRDQLQQLGPRLAACFREVELRALAERDETYWIRRSPSSIDPRMLEPELRALARDFVVRVEGTPSTPDQIQPLGETPALRVVPGMFTQVNPSINAAIVRELVSGAVERGVKTFLDLHSGNGNLSLPLLAMGARGLGIEANPEAVECANLAAEAGGHARCFEVDAVERALPRLAASGRRFDLVVLDPPRAGFPGIAALAALGPRWVFHCACDPVSFARDAARLSRAGYELTRIGAYDMFPQTHHVELAAWFSAIEP